MTGVYADNAGEWCGVLLFFLNHQPFLNIACPKIVEDMYTKQNKYFDKHELIRELTRRLTGDSILFADTNETWRNRRKALAPTFYKGKLVNMVEIAKGSVRKTINRL